MDLFTTPCRLSLRGQAALIALSSQYVAAQHGSISVYAASWDGVRSEDVAEFSRSVFRVVRRAGNFELAAQRPVGEGRDARVLPFPIAQIA
jgi:hypothetical protein